jgi:hypothetical protein
MELNVFVTMVILCIKVFVELLLLLFQFVLVTAILMVYFAHVMMDIINYGKDIVVNVQQIQFGMEILVKQALYVKKDTHIIIKQINVKRKESIVDKMPNGME